MAHYLVKAKAVSSKLSELRARLDEGAIKKMRPFGTALDFSLRNARLDSAGWAVWEEEDYCQPPLAMERAAVLDSYFRDLSVEKVAEDAGWQKIDNLGSLWQEIQNSVETNFFQVEQLDHVEVFVPRQYEAAQWYKQVLGLKILKEHEHWADDGGPLMISSDGGNTMLALFKGQAQGKQAVIGHRRVAFRVSGEKFLDFLNQAHHLQLFDEQGQLLTPKAIDHEKAWSIYFCDPYGNPYEITTYDYAVIQEQTNTQ